MNSDPHTHRVGGTKTRLGVFVNTLKSNLFSTINIITVIYNRDRTGMDKNLSKQIMLMASSTV